MKWSLFFMIVHLAFSKLSPMSFLLFKVPLKLLYWYVMKLHCTTIFLFMSSPSTYLIVELNFQFWIQEKLTQRSRENGRCCTCSVLCFTQKYSFQKYASWLHNFFKFTLTYLDKVEMFVWQSRHKDIITLSHKLLSYRHVFKILNFKF